MTWAVLGLLPGVHLCVQLLLVSCEPILVFPRKIILRVPRGHLRLLMGASLSAC